MTKFRKLAVGILAAATMTTCMAGFSSSAVVLRRPDNFLSCTEKLAGRFSSLKSTMTIGSITATNTDYTGSYKLITYLVQKKVGEGKYVTLSATTNDGTTSTVLAVVEASTYDSSEAARRYVSGKCYVASNVNSGVAETLILDIRKSSTG